MISKKQTCFCLKFVCDYLTGLLSNENLDLKVRKAVLPFQQWLLAYLAPEKLPF